MKRELDLEDEDSEKLDQIWIEESAKLFIEDLRDPNDVESFRQLNQLLHEQRLEDIKLLNQEKLGVKNEKEILLIDMLSQELEGYEARYQMKQGLGYDEIVLSRHLPDRETKEQALLRTQRFEQLKSLAQNVDVSSGVMTVFNRVTDDNRFIFLGGCLSSEQLSIPEYFEKSLNQKRWPIIVTQLQTNKTVDELIIDTEMVPFESSFIDNLTPDIVIDKSESSTELEVTLVTSNEEKAESFESIIVTDVEDSFGNVEPINADLENELVSNEAIELVNEQEIKVDTKEEIYKDGLTLAQYIALHPGLFTDDTEEEIKEISIQKEDSFEI